MSKTRELVQPVEMDNGERVLPATRRPDGTLRKERKIKPGYTPQDEQPIYQSQHVLARQNVPVCPGMDPSMLVQAQQAKSKAAKKNEKRKEKKADGADGAGASTSSATGASVAAATQQMSQLSTGKPQSAARPAASTAAAPAAAAGPSEPEDPKAAAEKALRNLKKKIRQAEALVEKQSSGTALSAEEADKASKLPGWLAEAKGLEDKIASL